MTNNNDKLNSYYARKQANKASIKNESVFSETIIAVTLVLFSIFAASISEVDASQKM